MLAGLQLVYILQRVFLTRGKGGGSGIDSGSTPASIIVTEKKVKTNSVLRKKKWVFLIFKLISRLYIYIICFC